ncbi:MAG: FAD:protein FMN transferase [Verrucomicrobiota bacterium]
MKTSFTLRLKSADRQLCNSVAQATISLIDEIEQALSKYREGGEVWQINQMKAGETLFLNDFCYECLQLGLEAYVETEGLFDITLGRQIEHTKSSAQGPAPEATGQLMIDPDRPAIHCIEPGREIDLGGIGKGFALDQAGKLVLELGIESAILSAGASTQLAVGKDAWEIQLQGEEQTKAVSIKNQALSASGTAIQGSHIVSPNQDSAEYASNRVWVIDETAAMADAYSTAALLMNPEQLQILKTKVGGVFQNTDDGILPI